MSINKIGIILYYILLIICIISNAFHRQIWWVTAYFVVAMIAALPTLLKTFKNNGNG